MLVCEQNRHTCNEKEKKHRYADVVDVHDHGVNVIMKLH
jgi:hypothetical protein